jgi:serine protease Do
MAKGLLTAWAFLLAGGMPSWAQASHSANPLSELSGSIRKLTNRVAPAVVEIVVTGYSTSDDDDGQTANRISRQRSSGSGVIVDPSGFIMTNAHVVRGVVDVKVLVPGSGSSIASGSRQAMNTRTLDARILGIDRESDLALIKVDERGLPALRLGDSDKLRQGDLVFAVGSPLGLRNSVSMGVVSAAARAVSNENPILYIQTDASINPGNSGGALVDTTGALVGLSTFIVSHSGGNEGIGFAIPSNVVRNVYEQLRTKGHVSRGSIGLFVQDMSPVLAKGLGLSLEQGVLVSDVEPEGPAERAGLKRRDIILSVNGLAIDTARQFESDIFRRHGGEKITLNVQRGNDRISWAVEIKEQSAPWDPLAALATPEKNLIPRLGILCLEIDKKVAELMPELRRQYGLIVAAKAPEGPSQFTDLQPGDVIYAINNLTVVLLSAFQETVKKLKPGDAVVLQIEREAHLRYVAFEIE